MDDSLPESFEVVIVGTGLQESILSGAFSRIGKRVLHIDPNDYYGGDWASFNINSIKEFLSNSNNESSESYESEYECASHEDLYFLQKPRKTVEGFVEDRSNITNTQATVNDASVEDQSVSPENEGSSSPRTEDNQAEDETNQLLNKWRQFNIDVIPKLLFSRGLLVDLLIQSNVSRYLEFKIVDRVFATLHGTEELKLVPCSRADVFNSGFISPIDKRRLMILLNIAANYEDHAEKYQEYKERPYREFLQSEGLNLKLQDFIIYSIAMVTDETNTVEGLKSTKKFLRSLGRYGNSAFIWPTYGVGEIPQAFSRLSAVFGGLFCLRRSAKSLITDRRNDGRCTAIIDSTGQKINCDHLILNEQLIPHDTSALSKRKYYRAVYVTDSSLYPSDDEHISLGVLNPTESEPVVRLIEVGSCAGVCPYGSYLVHAVIDAAHMSTQPSNTKEVFSRTERILFGNSNSPVEGKPKKIWACYFSVISSLPVDRSALPNNVHVTLGPDLDLGFDQSVKEAKEIFDKICPGEEFLPRAPDPEEIIFDEDDEGYNTERTSIGVSSTQSSELRDILQQSTEDNNENADYGNVENVEAPNADD